MRHRFRHSLFYGLIVVCVGFAFPALGVERCDRTACETAMNTHKTHVANFKTIQADLNTKLMDIVLGALEDDRKAILTQRNTLQEFLTKAEAAPVSISSSMIGTFITDFNTMLDKKRAWDLGTAPAAGVKETNYELFVNTLYPLYLDARDVLGLGSQMDFYAELRGKIEEKRQTAATALKAAEKLQVWKDPSTIRPGKPPPELNGLQNLVAFKLGKLGQLAVELTEGQGGETVVCENWTIATYEKAKSDKKSPLTPTMIFRHRRCAETKQNAAATSAAAICLPCKPPVEAPDGDGVMIVSASYAGTCETEAMAYFLDKCQDLLFQVTYCLKKNGTTGELEVKTGTTACGTPIVATFTRPDYRRQVPPMRVCRFRVNSREFCPDQPPGQEISVTYKCSAGAKPKPALEGKDQRMISLDCR